MPATFHGSSVPVGGIPMYSCSGGRAVGGGDAGVPFVLVHGAVVSGRYMLRSAALLARAHAVHVPDLPGYGASGSPPAPLGVPGLADALLAWLDAMGIARAHLLGNSMGCQVIVDLAARYPARVAGVVLVGPTVDRAARTRVRQLWRLALDALRETPSLIPLHVVDIFRAGWRFAAASLDIALADRIEDKIPDVRAPVLVVCGSHDPLAPVGWCEWLASRRPGTVLHVIDGPHALNYSRPVELVACVDAWLTASGRVAAGGRQ